MGNRAVITTEANLKEDGVGIYVHWNGGRDSVEGFLTYCRLRGFRCPDQDNYGWARLTQVIANFFGGEGTSIGFDRVSNLDCDNGDNGTYLIQGWEIVGRRFFSGEEQDAYSLERMVLGIDHEQPEAQRLGEGLVKLLLRNNLTISDVDSMYHYRIKKETEEWEEEHPGEARPFKRFTVGGMYKADYLRRSYYEKEQFGFEVTSIDREGGRLWVQAYGVEKELELYPLDGLRCEAVVIETDKGIALGFAN